MQQQVTSVTANSNAAMSKQYMYEKFVKPYTTKHLRATTLAPAALPRPLYQISVDVLWYMQQAIS